MWKAETRLCYAPSLLCLKIKLHDLILSQAASMLSALHGIAVALVGVLDVGETKRTTAILVARELG
jgi:hypothetical protein